MPPHVPLGPPPAAAISRLWLSRLLSAVTWNIAGTAPTRREHARLAGRGITAARVQSLLAWRRSAIVAATPILGVSLVLAAMDAARTDTDYLTVLGILTLWVPALALTLLVTGAVVVIARWTRLKSPVTALLWCWAGSIALPLMAALAPLDVLLDLDRLRSEALSAQDLADIQLVVSAGRLGMAVGYALTLLPVVVSVPAGVLKGAWRVKSLFPSAALPGWFLVAVAPFYSLFMVVLFVLINQIAGNALLLLGVALLAVAPWTFVVFRRTFIHPLASVHASARLPMAARIARVFTLCGALLLVIYLFTARIDGTPVMGAAADSALFTYLEVGRAVVEVLGRSIITSVAFCMIFLGMLESHWRTDRTLPGHIRAEYDEQMSVYSAHAAARPGV